MRRGRLGEAPLRDLGRARELVMLLGGFAQPAAFEDELALELLLALLERQPATLGAVARLRELLGVLARAPRLGAGREGLGARRLGLVAKGGQLTFLGPHAPGQRGLLAGGRHQLAFGVDAPLSLALAIGLGVLEAPCRVVRLRLGAVGAQQRFLQVGRTWRRRVAFAQLLRAASASLRAASASRARRRAPGVPPRGPGARPRVPGARPRPRAAPRRAARIRLAGAQPAGAGLAADLGGEALVLDQLDDAAQRRRPAERRDRVAQRLVVVQARGRGEDAEPVQPRDDAQLPRLSAGGHEVLDRREHPVVIAALEDRMVADAR